MSFPLSIIIPTCGRPQILRRCLDCIEAQTQKNLEVIVVSDGPDEKTAEMFQGLSWNMDLQYFSVPKSQQGIARNRGLEKARGEYVLLIGDDAFLAPDACERHMLAHSRHNNAAVLGFTTWDPALNITPLMRWMEKTGVQFGYEKIAQYAGGAIPKEIQHLFAYTIHISLSAKLLYTHPFREDVSLYGWEDIEWGKRLADANIPMIYEPTAKAYHHHAYTDEQVWKRSRLLGESAVHMTKLVPELSIVPRGWKHIAYHLLALLPTYRGKHCREFLKGMRLSNSSNLR